MKITVPTRFRFSLGARMIDLPSCDQRLANTRCNQCRHVMWSSEFGSLSKQGYQWAEADPENYISIIWSDLGDYLIFVCTDCFNPSKVRIND